MPEDLQIWCNFLSGSSRLLPARGERPGAGCYLNADLFPGRGQPMPQPGVALEKLGFLTIGLFDGQDGRRVVAIRDPLARALPGR